ncbi:MAG: hypothetical protein VYA86_01805 [Candidatus Thermoplasmatota archaeon]|nr:hypothetical protein [Candidatus Thermoplasmatota archaeon]
MTSNDLAERTIPRSPALDEQRATHEAQKQALKVIPYFLGLGWVLMIPASYFFIAPAIVEGFVLQLLVTVGITIATGVADFAFYKIFANIVEAQAQHLEPQSNEAEQEPTGFAKILGQGEIND